MHTSGLLFAKWKGLPMLENYEPVSARLDRWLQAHAGRETRVITELVHYLQDMAVFRAELWLDGTLIATGWAEEIRGQGNVNRTSHIENCETSAVGRALANAGMAGSDYTKRPSREEMAKVERSSAGATGGVVRQLTGEASEKQIAYIKGACKRAGVIAPRWIDTMSKADASAFIEAEKNGEPVQQIIDRMRGEEAF